MRPHALQRTSLVGFTLIEIMVVIVVLGVLAATAAMAYAAYLRVAETEVVVADFRMALGATTDAYAAALSGQTTDVLQSVNGRNAANGVDRHNPFLGTAPAFVVGKAPICGQIALSAQTIAPGSPKSLTLLLGTTGCQDPAIPSMLATGVAKIGYPSAATHGVVVDQNGGIQ